MYLSSACHCELFEIILKMRKSSSHKLKLFFLGCLIFWAPASLALSPASIDTDQDGVEDSIDFDDDGDGISDSFDSFPKNPRYTKDSDSDGLPDKWEPLYGLNPNDPGVLRIEIKTASMQLWNSMQISAKSKGFRSRYTSRQVGDRNDRDPTRPDYWIEAGASHMRGRRRRG